MTASTKNKLKTNKNKAKQITTTTKKGGGGKRRKSETGNKYRHIYLATFDPVSQFMSGLDECVNCQLTEICGSGLRIYKDP